MAHTDDGDEAAARRVAQAVEHALRLVGIAIDRPAPVAEPNEEQDGAQRP